MKNMKGGKRGFGVQEGRREECKSVIASGAKQSLSGALLYAPYSPAQRVFGLKAN